MIIAKGKLTASGLTHASMIHLRTRLRGFNLFIVVFIFVTLGLCVRIWKGLLFEPTTIFLSVLVLIVLMLKPLTMLQAKLNLRYSPSLGKMTNWLLDEDSIQVSREDFNSTTQGQCYCDATITKFGILLYPQKHACELIPSSAFSTQDDLNQAVELVRRKIPTTKMVHSPVHAKA